MSEEVTASAIDWLYPGGCGQAAGVEWIFWSGPWRGLHAYSLIAVLQIGQYRRQLRSFMQTRYRRTIFKWQSGTTAALFKKLVSLARFLPSSLVQKLFPGMASSRHLTFCHVCSVRSFTNVYMCMFEVLKMNTSMHPQVLLTPRFRRRIGSLYQVTRTVICEI